MRKNILFTLVFLLGFLAASSASARFFSYFIGQSTGESNAHYQAKQKDMEEGRISCVPQQPPQAQLWSCQDAYGNQYPDMVITLKTEIDRIKGTRRASK